jgi:hypothetical protein
VKSRRWVTLSWQSGLENSEKHIFGQTNNIFRCERYCFQLNYFSAENIVKSNGAIIAPSIFMYKFGRMDIFFPAICFRLNNYSAELFFGRKIVRRTIFWPNIYSTELSLGRKMVYIWTTHRNWNFFQNFSVVSHYVSSFAVVSGCVLSAGRLCRERLFRERKEAVSWAVVSWVGCVVSGCVVSGCVCWGHREVASATDESATEVARRLWAQRMGAQPRSPGGRCVYNR